MAKILLLFASSYGQTAKVAEHLASRWREQGHAVEVEPFGPAEPSPAGFDAVILGSRLAVDYARSLKRYVKRHRSALAARHSGFFSVSMSAASADPSVEAKLRAKIGELLHETHWSPAHVASFAGALPYTRYDPVTRAVIKFISARAGHPTNTSRDYEFTDWSSVDRFADAVSETLTQSHAHFGKVAG
ncbi:MAG TPA: flavodoxin domain-containing protein [Polyangiaceae bacterium]|nr:flavodoxin domain-containing protein [Polyangiaceae bacterium]